MRQRRAGRFRRIVIRGALATVVAVALGSGTVADSYAVRAADGPTVPTGPTGPTGPATLATPTLPLAFDMPSTSTLRASPKKVFAHYVPSLPVSIDNKEGGRDYYAVNYVAPGGEGGKHRPYGGFLRDRPQVRPVRSGDWMTADMREEVRTAIAAGIDGFTVDLLSLPGHGRPAEDVERLLKAAHDVDPGFSIVLMPDMTAGWRNSTPDQLATYIARLATFPAAMRTPDGRLVVAPYTAEMKSADWWKSFISALAGHSLGTAFVPVFQDERPQLAAFSSFSYGMGNWGARDPKGNTPNTTDPRSYTARARAVAALGKVWMAPVSIQDERPRSGKLWEAGNSENLRNSWQIAVDSGAPWVQLTTWNDYTEGSAFAPSAYNGVSWLDLNSYYVAWFKTGVEPAVVRDVLYLSARAQPFGALPSFPQTTLMRLADGTPLRDTVEVLAMLHAAGTVTITTGAGTTAAHTTTCQLPAGVQPCLAPLTPGPVTATATTAWSSQVLRTTVNSARPVSNSPWVQDLGYYAASSARQNGSAVTTLADAASPASGAPSVAPIRDRLAPTAPAALRAARARLSHRVRLAWAASKDRVGVVAYDVQRSSTPTFTRSTTRRLASAHSARYLDRTAAPGRWYYRVIARDATGNRSKPSRVVTVVVPRYAAGLKPAS